MKPITIHPLSALVGAATLALPASAQDVLWSVVTGGHYLEGGGTERPGDGGFVGEPRLDVFERDRRLVSLGHSARQGHAGQARQLACDRVRR